MRLNSLKTLDKRLLEGGNSDDTKEGHYFLRKKYRVTPSVTAPVDTNLSDATVCIVDFCQKASHILLSIKESKDLQQ